MAVIFGEPVYFFTPRKVCSVSTCRNVVFSPCKHPLRCGQHRAGGLADGEAEVYERLAERGAFAGFDKAEGLVRDSCGYGDGLDGFSLAEALHVEDAHGFIHDALAVELRALRQGGVPRRLATPSHSVAQRSAAAGGGRIGGRQWLHTIKYGANSEIFQEIDGCVFTQAKVAHIASRSSLVPLASQRDISG
jgi:hypothetical protein